MTAQTLFLGDGRELIIREAQPQDAQAILTYIEMVCAQTDFLSFGPGEFDFSVEQEAEFLAQCLFAHHQVYIIATCGQTVVGSLNFSAGARARVRHAGEFGMSVDKNYWRMGIGRALVSALIGWAREVRFIKKLNLRVRSDNQPAIALYQGMGFVNEGRISNEMFIGGRFYDLDCMGLVLE